MGQLSIPTSFQNISWKLELIILTTDNTQDLAVQLKIIHNFRQHVRLAVLSSLKTHFVIKIKSSQTVHALLNFRQLAHFFSIVGVGVKCKCVMRSVLL